MVKSLGETDSGSLQSGKHIIMLLLLQIYQCFIIPKSLVEEWDISSYLSTILRTMTSL